MCVFSFNSLFNCSVSWDWMIFHGPGSQGYTPVTTHSLSPSLVLRWFSGWSGELRCISTQTGATGSLGNPPDNNGRSCLFNRNTTHPHSNVAKCPKKPNKKMANLCCCRFIATIDRRYKMIDWQFHNHTDLYVLKAPS